MVGMGGSPIRDVVVCFVEDGTNNRIGYTVMPLELRERLFESALSIGMVTHANTLWQGTLILWLKLNEPCLSSTEWSLPFLSAWGFGYEPSRLVEAFTLTPCSSLRLYPGLAAHMWVDLSPKSWVSGPVAAGPIGWGLQHTCNCITHAHTGTKGKFGGLLKYESQNTNTVIYMQKGTDAAALMDRLKSIRWLIEHCRSETAHGRMKVEWARLRGSKRGGWWLGQVHLVVGLIDE